MKCPQCGGSGRLPLLNKQGLVVPNARVYCSCHEDEPEHYQPMDVSDFDFACSSAFRAYQYDYLGQPDPCAVTATTERTKEVIIREAPANLQHFRAELNHFTNKLNEHLDASKKRVKQKKTSGYRGLSV